jgi:outer membrane protein TolC
MMATSVRAEETYTLETAFSAVEKVNVNVLISREAMAQAVGLANQQRSALLPRVNLDAQQKRSRSINVNGDTVTDTGITNRFDGKLTGSFNLLSPSQIASYRAARRGTEAAAYDYNLTLQNILDAVGQVYFLHQRNQQRVTVLDANVSRAQVLVDLARRKLSAGVTTQIDVTRSEAQLAAAEQARLQQDTVVMRSEMQLKQLLDIEADRSLKLTPFNVRRDSHVPTAIEDDKRVYDQRADMGRARKLLQQSKETLRAAKMERLGSLNMFGEYGYTSAEAFDGKEREAWMGGVDFSIPIFDAFRISADKRIALAQMRSQEYRLRSLQILISSEVRLALQDVRSRQAQVNVAERSLKLSQDELDLARRRYEQGVADNREMVDAQNQLAQAEDNLVEAVYQYNLSRLELARATGEVRSILNEKSN